MHKHLLVLSLYRISLMHGHGLLKNSILNVIQVGNPSTPPQYLYFFCICF